MPGTPCEEVVVVLKTGIWHYNIYNHEFISIMVFKVFFYMTFSIKNNPSYKSATKEEDNRPRLAKALRLIT